MIEMKVEGFDGWSGNLYAGEDRVILCSSGFSRVFNVPRGLKTKGEGVLVFTKRPRNDQSVKFDFSIEERWYDSDMNDNNRNHWNPAFEGNEVRMYDDAEEILWNLYQDGYNYMTLEY